MKNIGLISAFVYTGISLIMVAVFLIATLARHYTIVERVGGAVWVFMLSMIILMPIVIPTIKKRYNRGLNS
jgi:hypothetical protein